MRKLNSRNLHLPLTSFCKAARTKLHSNDSNLVLRDLSKSGRIEESRQLFDKMPERDKFTWNTMIFAYSCSGRLADAKQLFLRNPIKNTISWSALISGYCKYGSEEEAFGFFFREMQFDVRIPDEYTLVSVFRICSSLCLLLRG